MFKVNDPTPQVDQKLKYALYIFKRCYIKLSTGNYILGKDVDFTLLSIIIYQILEVSQKVRKGFVCVKKKKDEIFKFVWVLTTLHYFRRQHLKRHSYFDYLHSLSLERARSHLKLVN